MDAKLEIVGESVIKLVLIVFVSGNYKEELNALLEKVSSWEERVLPYTQADPELKIA